MENLKSKKSRQKTFYQKYQQSKKWENTQYIKIPNWERNCLGKGFVALLSLHHSFPVFFLICKLQMIQTLGKPRRFQPDRIIETRVTPQPWRCSLQPTLTTSQKQNIFQKNPPTNHEKNTNRTQNHNQKFIPHKKILLLSVSFLFSWSFSSPPLLLAFRSLPAVSPQPPSAASPAAATIRRASAGGRRGPSRRPRCEDEELQRPPKCWSREGGRPVKVWRCSNFFVCLLIICLVSYSTSRMLICLFICWIVWLVVVVVLVLGKQYMYHKNGGVCLLLGGTNKKRLQHYEWHL